MPLILLAMSLLVCPALAQAGVTRLQIERREVVLNGQPFGAAGPYEKIAGKVHFALDPTLPQNRGIVDLNLAPKNAQGLVEFAADFYLVKPVDPARGNGRLFYEAGNRGTKRILPVFQDAVRHALLLAQAVAVHSGRSLIEVEDMFAGLLLAVPDSVWGKLLPGLASDEMLARMGVARFNGEVGSSFVMPLGHTARASAR